MADGNLNNVWPEWKVVKQLGRGSFGVVYEAVRQDHQVESRAAIKVISIPQNDSEIDSLRSEGYSKDATKTYLQGIVEDFVNEIQLMETFKGVQNIVSVEDYKVVEKTEGIGWDIYIRMELLTPFSTYICDKTLSEQEVIKLGCDICTALELCAKRNVIHRDIKPENIFVNDFGDFKLGDFGIARKLENVTGGLSQKGTYNYMAPEIEKGTNYDATVDLYSLGLVLYRFLNKNRLPFLDTEKQVLNANERMEAMKRRMAGETLPVPCEATPAMAQIILCACAFEPEKRFRSAAAMKNSLLSIKTGGNFPNRTAPVNSTQQAIDKTISLKQEEQEQKDKKAGRGNKKKDKKKSKAPKIAVAILALILLAGSAGFAAWRFSDKVPVSDVQGTAAASKEKSTEGTSSLASAETDAPLESDEKQIGVVIEEAESLAAGGDYQGGLAKLQEGIAAYPESKVLKAKEEAYKKEIGKQEKKGEILAEAASFAEAGDYASAVERMKNVQADYSEDEDFKAAFDTYNKEYTSQIKEAAITEAEGLAAEGKYPEAINVINQAGTTIGEDAELAEKAKEYGDSYVSDIISKVDELVAAKDIASAESTLTAALKVLPQNQALQKKKEAVGNCKPQNLLDVCAPYQTERYHANKSYSLAGSSYINGFHLEDGTAYFNLDGRYDTLGFDVGHIDGSQLKTGYYYFYLDGTLVYTLTLDPAMLVQHVEIPLNGAIQMKIEGGDWSRCFALVNVTVTGNADMEDVQETEAFSKDAKFLLDVCAPYQTESYHANKSYSLAGDSYINGFHLEDGTAYFNLDGKYDTLSFDVGHIDGTRMKTGYYYFYLDGTLVYTLTLDPAMLVQHVEIPLNGAVQMKIEGGDWSRCFALVNVTVS